MSQEFGRASTVIIVSGEPVPDWAAAVGAAPLDGEALKEGSGNATWLAEADCVLVDAAWPGFVAQARRVHQLDDSIQIIAVTPPERLQATRRAILYSPGLGEIWVASPAEVTSALEQRAAGVTRQRRRFEQTRSRIAADAIAGSPQRNQRAFISDAYLAGLLRVLADPVFSVDATGRILSANAAAEADVAHQGGLIGEPLGQFLGLEPTRTTAELLSAAQARPIRIGFRNAAGQRRLGELRASPLMMMGEQGWAVVLHDITEVQEMVDQLEETAHALRDSEATYRGLVDAMPTLAWTARADGYIDWYNRRWYEYTGTSPEQMEGWGWQAVHDQAVLPEVMSNWGRSIETGVPFEMTFPLRSADGSFRSFLTRVVPLRDEAGRVIRWFGTNTDVQAERESRERIEHLQSITSALAAVQTLEDVASVVVANVVAATGAATGMLAVSDPGGANARVVQRSGLEPLGGPSEIESIIRVDGPSSECLRTAAPIFVESPAELSQRYPKIAHQLDRLALQAVASLPLTVAGELVGVLTFGFRNPRKFPPADEAFFLSLARQCAQALERARLFAAESEARKAADEANRAKSQFLATMSHELRTPLNAINGHVSLVLEEIYGPVRPEQRAALERVVRAQEHLLGVINDVLSFARIESGRLDFQIERINPIDLIRNVVPLIEPQLTHKGLLLDVGVGDANESIPSVLADADKAGQILINLLSNATKFTPSGGRISITTSGAVSGGQDFIEIAVADTGIGIPPEMHESIFDPFVQVKGDLTRTREGTGLGLAISRDLARSMGGSLTVKSVLGAGSTFTLSLPVALPSD